MKASAEELFKWVERSQKQQSDWYDSAEQIIQRYALEGSSSPSDNLDSGDTFNILWSNVQTLKPALYSRMPKAAVERRFGDQDPIARTACMILERACNYELECYPDFHSAMKASVLDRLLPGRGVAWVRYDPAFKEVDDETSITEDSQKPQKLEVIDYERSPVDYVHWKDFFMDVCRSWEENGRVGRRVLMSRKKGKDRFGKVFEDASFDAKPDSIDDSLRSALSTEEDNLAEVYEIWDKSEAKVYWVAKGIDKILDEADDPLDLEGFFPCPKPLFATITNESLIPTPDFFQYVTQAAELDEITSRMQMISKALVVAGAYAGDEKNILGQMFTGDGSPRLIPVDTWAAFADKGGIKGLIDWFPVDQVVAVLQALTATREGIKQTIYELTGISDIVRGASDASETATAQNIKGKYANMRLSDSQQDVAEFAQDLIRIKVNVMAAKYSPETLITQSGIMETDDKDKAEQAIALIKSGQILSFRVSVNADDLSEMRQMQVKQDRNEFLTAAGGYLSQVQGLIQQAPELTQLAGRLLMFGIQSFPEARQLEGAFEAAFEAFTKGQAQRQQQQQAEQEQSNQQMQQAQAALADNQAGREHEMQIKSAELQAKTQEAEAQRAHELKLASGEGQLRMAETAVKIATANKLQQETIKLQMENATYAEHPEGLPKPEPEGAKNADTETA